MQINLNKLMPQPSFSGKLGPKYNYAKDRAIQVAQANWIRGLDGVLFVEARNLAKELVDMPVDCDFNRGHFKRSKEPYEYKTEAVNSRTGQVKDVHFLFKSPKINTNLRRYFTTTHSTPNPSRQGSLQLRVLNLALSNPGGVTPLSEVKTKSQRSWDTSTGDVFLNGCQSRIIIPNVQIDPNGSPRTLTTAYKESGARRNIITQLFRLSPDRKTPGLEFALHHSDNDPPRSKISLVHANGKRELLFNGAIEE